MAFKPAALKKNEPFFDDKMQRAPEPKRLKEYYAESQVVINQILYSFFIFISYLIIGTS